MIHSQQLDLLDHTPAPFRGWTYSESLDRRRLTSNLRRVCFALLDGRWHILSELRLIGGSAADSRIRDLHRLPRTGGFGLPIQSHRRAHGCWEYRLEIERVTREQLDAVFGK